MYEGQITRYGRPPRAYALGATSTTMTNFDYRARATELAASQAATIGSFSPWTVVQLGLRGANPSVQSFQDEDAARAVYTAASNTIEATKAYVGLFYGDANKDERFYGTSSYIDVVANKLKSLKGPVLAGGVIIAIALLVARSPSKKARRRRR